MARNFDVFTPETGRRRGQKIRTGIEQQLMGLRRMQIPEESQRAYQESQMMANQGISSAAKQLAQQQSSRQMAAGVQALGTGRQLLAGVGGLVRAGQDQALQLARMDEEARRANRLMAMQQAQQMGAQKSALERYKQEGLYNYYTGRKRERRQTLSNLLQMATSIGASYLSQPK